MKIKDREARNIAKAQLIVLSSTRWLSAFEISRGLGVNENAISVQLKEWKSNPKLFSISHNGIELYPLYVFEDSIEFFPLAGMQQILTTFESLGVGILVCEPQRRFTWQ